MPWAHSPKRQKKKRKKKKKKKRERERNLTGKKGRESILEGPRGIKV